MKFRSRRCWWSCWWWWSVLVLPNAGGAGACPASCLCDFGREPRTVKCAGQGLTTFPENISGLVENLDLSNNQLTEIPEYITQLDDLQQLNLAHNQLSHLPDKLHGLFNLLHLDLGHNEFQDVSDLAPVQHLPRLKSLVLTSNALGSLDGLKNPTIEYLKADDCGITALQNTSLFGLPELAHLNLARNSLKENIMNPYGPNLRGLDLSRCDLAEFKSEMIQGFPELTDLRLADNPELYYSTKFMTLRHPNLQKLDASRCKLDRPGLHGLPSLTFARLTGNSIKMLPDRIFSKNTKLTHLFLDFNSIDRLNKSSFANLFKLQMLDLSTNGLKTVPSTAFEDNVELQSLNLSDNYLKDFPKLSSSLISLDLSENSINKMENDCLAGLPRLFYLNLRHNLILEFPKALAAARLRSFVLRSNLITNLNNVSLKGLPELEKLDLSENALTGGITPELFYDNPNLRKLHLQNNPWHCDCDQLYSFFVFLTTLETKTEPLICSTPANLNGYSWKSACIKPWQNKSYQHRYHGRAWGLVLVVLLIMIVLTGMIISIRHSMKLKRQARNHRLEIERAEVRERLRLLQRRNMNLHDDVEHGSEPRIHPLELISPPSYEEAVTMPRLARSLDALNSMAGETVTRMTASSESLRTKKLRRTRRARGRLRSLSEDNLARRELRREERLRRVRGEPEGGNEQVVVVIETPHEHKEEGEVEENNDSTATKRKSRRLSAKTGTSTDDEDSDVPKEAKGERKVGKTVIRNLGKEPRCGYRPSTDGDSN